MSKITLVILLLLLLTTLPGCAVCEWFLGGAYSAADSSDRWSSSTGQDFQQSDF
ncbi:hypothetical protein LOC68_15155 [Blastopirellula sp. JC732]|uniref:Uncharacterized protein n=1 Tax=Blastopirellula sediminis TaxID=2894196 RepID=A0A9X1SGT8_9BACT|nr:hypothetical protein [Blastopirellula sediminis]MCC9606977.1 hypothetical protein [Blastopirellula sediminis]MCC9629728.1 hypothetical protein [Blastopirellula sediminis]